MFGFKVSIHILGITSGGLRLADSRDPGPPGLVVLPDSHKCSFVSKRFWGYPRVWDTRLVNSRDMGWGGAAGWE